SLVLDTNVRRVLSRLFAGEQLPPPTLSQGERRAAERWLPDDPGIAATWSVAVMELGALVCTARRPTCGECPVTDLCEWRSRGYPPYAGPARRGQAYAGTDRQCRGRILSLLRDADAPVSHEAVTLVWDEGDQRQRALASLIDDGLVVETEEGVALPSALRTSAVAPLRWEESPGVPTSPSRRR
ncbi:MAG: hypothetical protein H0V07_13695, partial [Propionibacteriales bacterium]|nr:hypothetical protein [Propionibacteriales bacterium]